MELQDVEPWEIAPFFDSLGHEKELVMMNAESVMASSFVAGIRVDSELAGITGIRKSYSFIPALFIVVKAKFHGMNVGNELMEKNLYFAQKNYDFLTLSTDRSEEYKAALHLYDKYGFKGFYRKGNHIWMCITFNRKGEIVCKLLPLVLPVLPYLISLFSGQILVQVYNKLFRRKIKSLLP